jgi:hypothetical protein
MPGEACADGAAEAGYTKENGQLDERHRGVKSIIRRPVGAYR